MKIKTNINNLKNYRVFLLVEKAIEEFLQKKGYLRCHLPVLSPALIPESYLKVFETECNYLTKKEKLYLTPSPELFLKRLLTQKIGNCYYLGKAFRKGELPSSLHLFEFNILEYYKIGVNYLKLADELLELLQFIVHNLKSQSRFNRDQISNLKSTSKILKLKNKLIYQGKEISFKKWEKISVAEAFEKYSGINERELFNQKLFIKKAQIKGYQVERFSYQDLWSQIYTQEIEPHLGMNGYPTLIYDYPKEFAALAKLNPDEKTAQRFEFYIAGIELGDCYTELTNWKEQEKRFNKEKVGYPIDKGLIEALKYGLPDCSGIAIGVERLAMIFANVTSIDQLRLINIG